MDLINARKLNEQVYALSKMSHRHQNVPTRPPTMGPEEKKHLRILNRIALFLVTEDKGDVAAVTFKQSTDTIDVYYAKNSPTNGVLDNYIKGMLNDIAKGKHLPLELAMYGIAMRAIGQCIKKIRSRIQKLLKSLRNVLGNDLCDDNEIVQRLFPTADLSTENRSEIVEYFKDLKELHATNLEKLKDQIDELVCVAFASYNIGKWKGFALGEEFERLQRRMKKLGDYYGGAIDIARVCHEHQKEIIRVIEIPPPSPKSGIVWRNSLKIMNIYCEEGTETDSTKFSRKFPDLDDEPQDEGTLETCVHCELTVLLDSTASTAFPTKIGVSKHCCWLCEQYIAAFQDLHEKGKKILVSGFQGKIHAGWLMPPGTPPAVQTRIEELLTNELDEIRADVNALRRSDSWPAGSDENEATAAEKIGVSRNQAKNWGNFWRSQ